MESFGDIIQSQPEKKKGSERADVLKYFVANLKNKNKKPFSARMIAIKLAHLSLKDLYYFKSVCSDIDNRSGNTAMNKYFWWSLKSDK